MALSVHGLSSFGFKINLQFGIRVWKESVHRKCHSNFYFKIGMKKDIFVYFNVDSKLNIEK